MTRGVTEVEWFPAGLHGLALEALLIKLEQRLSSST